MSRWQDLQACHLREKGEIINPTYTEHDFLSLGLINVKLYTAVYIQVHNMASVSIIKTASETAFELINQTEHLFIKLN